MGYGIEKHAGRVRDVGVIIEHYRFKDEAIREGIKEYGNWPTIPQLYINKELIGGCDIISELFDSGELQKKIETCKQH